MKKLRTILLSLCIITSACFPVYASSNDTDVSERILSIEQTYFASHNVESRQELTADQINELSRLIQAEKNNLLGDNPNIYTSTDITDYTGGIFLQFDSSSGSGSLGWAHGHAAIGYGNGTIEILGPKDKVEQYDRFRIDQWYNLSKTGGFYTVRSANSKNNKDAADNAYAKIGSKYFIIGDGDFSGYTCSGLVATSWTEAGFNLGGKWTTPASLERNSKTICQWLWADV